jgi:hypothetical protein
MGTHCKHRVCSQSLLGNVRRDWAPCSCARRRGPAPSRLFKGPSRDCLPAKGPPRSGDVGQSHSAAGPPPADGRAGVQLAHAGLVPYQRQHCCGTGVGGVRGTCQSGAVCMGAAPGHCCKVPACHAALCVCHLRAMSPRESTLPCVALLPQPPPASHKPRFGLQARGGSPFVPSASLAAPWLVPPSPTGTCVGGHGGVVAWRHFVHAELCPAHPLRAPRLGRRHTVLRANHLGARGAVLW